MPKPLSQRAVKQLADEWAALQSLIRHAEQAKQRAIDPIIQRHNEELKPVLDKHERKIANLREQSDAIEARVTEWLGAQGSDVTVAGEFAVASRTTETKIGGRVVDVRKFIDAAKSKGEAMWDCLTVAVAKAEKLLGEKELDAISTKKETTTVLATLRLK